MADRNRELVPDNWSLVRERVLTTGLCSEGWYSQHSGACRRVDLPGRKHGWSTCDLFLCVPDLPKAYLRKMVSMRFIEEKAEEPRPYDIERLAQMDKNDVKRLKGCHASFK